MTNPFMIPQPFANNGNKNDIKDVRDPIDPIQTASWLTGFPPVTMTPEEAGGLPPNGLDMNGALNAVSQGLVHRQRGERMQFSFAYATSIGGYPKGAIIQSNDMTKEFQSLVSDNVTDPNTTLGTFWKIYAGDGSVADGSQTQKGLVQFATAQQVQDKLDIARAINPANVGQTFDASLSTNGWCRLPNGLIMQWGEIPAGNWLNSQTGTQVFPISFSTACLQVIISSSGGVVSGGATDEGLDLVSKSNTGFKWISRWNSRLISHGSIPYFAIGY